MDTRTGKLRWVQEGEQIKENVAVTVEDAVLLLYNGLCAHAEPTDAEMPQMINQLFRKIDDDNSGAVAKPELKAALEEMGMYPSNVEVNTLMKAYDSSGEGLLDLPDFRTLILSAIDMGRAKRGAVDTSVKISTGPSEAILNKAGRRHPATIRVKYDSMAPPDESESEEEEEDTGEYFPDEPYIKQIFLDLDADGNGTLDVEELRLFGETLGMVWDSSFAEDIMLVVDGDNCDGTIDYEEFWNWYKKWSRQRHTKTNFVRPVVIGYTNPPPLSVMRRDRARLRLDRMGESMYEQVQAAITHASTMSHTGETTQVEEKGSAFGGLLNLFG